MVSNKGLVATFLIFSNNSIIQNSAIKPRTFVNADISRKGSIIFRGLDFTQLPYCFLIKFLSRRYLSLVNIDNIELKRIGTGDTSWVVSCKLDFEVITFRWPADGQPWILSEHIGEHLGFCVDEEYLSVKNIHCIDINYLVFGPNLRVKCGDRVEVRIDHIYGLETNNVEQSI